MLLQFIATKQTENECSTNMRSNSWLRKRRQELGIPTTTELARLLQLEGADISRGAVSAWETGRNKIPLDKPQLRIALMRVLRLTEQELLSLAGYDVVPVNGNEAARRAASIVSQLPPDKQDLAIRLLEQLRAS